MFQFTVVKGHDQDKQCKFVFYSSRSLQIQYKIISRVSNEGLFYYS